MPQTYSVELKQPERTTEVAGQYGEACCEVAAEAGVPCLNLWSTFQEVEVSEQAGVGVGGRVFQSSLLLLASVAHRPTHAPTSPPPQHTHAAAAACEQNWSEELLSDGLHLTPAGQAKAYVDLQTLINENYPQLQ